MADYKIGQMLTVSKDIEIEGISGKRKVVKKGTKYWIGADELAHYQDGTIQRLSEDSTVKGYDEEGIAEMIFMQLRADYPLQEFCKEYEVDPDEIKASMEWALNKILICF